MKRILYAVGYGLGFLAMSLVWLRCDWFGHDEPLGEWLFLFPRSWSRTYYRCPRCMRWVDTPEK